jgi:uncharacterized protein YlxW (UPF0749 family)
MKRNLTNIIKWFSSIGNLAKAIGAIIALAVSVVAGIKGYNAWIIRQHDKEIIQRQNQQAIICRLDSIKKGQTELITEVSEMKETINSHTKSLKALQNSHVNLLRETGKIDELIRYYESTQDMLKKNNSYINEIQLGPSPLWIPYSFK